MKLIILTILLLLLPATAFGDEVTLIYGFDPVLHFDRSNDFNERIGLLGISHNKWAIHTFSNSYEKRTTLVTTEVWRKSWFKNHNLEVYTNANVGLAHGYSGTDVWTFCDVTPWVYLSTNLKYSLGKRWYIGMHVSVVPALDSSVFSKNLALTYTY